MASLRQYDGEFCLSYAKGTPPKRGWCGQLDFGFMGQVMPGSIPGTRIMSSDTIVQGKVSKTSRGTTVIQITTERGTEITYMTKAPKDLTEVPRPIQFESNDSLTAPTDWVVVEGDVAVKSGV